MKKVTINPEFDCYVDTLVSLIKENVKNKKSEILDCIGNICEIARQWNEENQTINCNVYEDSDGKTVRKFDAEFHNAVQEIIRIFDLEPEEKEEKKYISDRFNKCMNIIIHNYVMKNIREMALVNELQRHGLYDIEKEYK